MTVKKYQLFSATVSTSQRVYIPCCSKSKGSFLAFFYCVSLQVHVHWVPLNHRALTATSPKPPLLEEAWLKTAGLGILKVLVGIYSYNIFPSGTEFTTAKLHNIIAKDAQYVIIYPIKHLFGHFIIECYPFSQTSMFSKHSYSLSLYFS